MSGCKKIGIMGGTFDPVHIGHLIVAEAARDAYDLDEVLFIPTGDPPHKKVEQLAPADKRAHMLELAVNGNSSFSVDMLEIYRKGITYTVDTLKELKVRYPKDAALYFIIGGDTLLEIDTWKAYEEVVQMCSFIVYQRPGYESEAVRHEALRLLNEYNANIHFVEGPFLEISSKDIRNRILLNKTIKYLVPESIERFIMERHLYKGELEDV